MATLTDIRTQVTAVNSTGRTNLAAKGVTVAQDADTATIMGAIATIPSGGATAPTFVEEITWDGDTTGLPSVELESGESKLTYYKVSDNVLPFMCMAGAVPTYTCTDNSDNAITTTLLAVDGFTVLSGAAICALYDNYTSASMQSMIAPSAGTWLMKDGNTYCKSVTVSMGE